jgi:diguanylate cyclase (GGDEF)-like protein
MRRVTACYLGGAALLVAVYPLLPPDVRTWVFDAASFSAAPVMLVALRRRRPPLALPWILVAAGQFCFFVGDALFDLYLHVLGRQPFPSLADVVYLAGYGLITAGLVSLVRHRAPDNDAASLIDASILTVGAGVLSWVFVIVPYATDGSLSAVERLGSVAYPLADLLLLGLIARLLLAPGRRAACDRLVAAGLLCHLLADTGYAAAVLFQARTSTTVLLDIGWLCGYALLVAAMVHPSVAEAETEAETGADGAADGAGDGAGRPAVATSTRRFVMLTGAALIAPGVLAVQSISHAAPDGAAIAATTGVLVVLVMLRMRGLLRQVEAQADALEARSRTDPLTGVLNRRGWDGVLAAALSDARRLGQPLTLAMIDLDRFKRYNDRYGHVAGDELLQTAVAGWRTQVRPGDVLGRFGGEEFTIALPNCTAAQAVEILERLQRNTPDGQTFSGGLAQWDGEEDGRALVARADGALYRAKRAGRARVETSAVTVATAADGAAHDLAASSSAVAASPPAAAPTPTAVAEPVALLH